MRSHPLIVVILGFAASGLATATGARESGTFAGPVEARILHVIDGDTFLAEANLWPGHHLRVNVRIRGIDAPEMKSRCDAERAAAFRARAALERLAGDAVSLSNIAGAKYYGRVLADVHDARGFGLAHAMLETALVRPYAGGRRGGWCD